ncbi:SufD family Fe-S cluster assembly protein [Parasphingorhabdus halotolerans]|uniref:SufD family Fe-S cluster assembly protein n=1 Tax=Parasphingorhabdus halotolerans TaxID=2725558 RepID=A0A6H2DP73_9SPHN|nr:SufD family Fe-S cluster assembly protein [Parasphingorhabdus halotolerans]QJB69783.1 SufD family Fe-S cluster assembly protein [Parasphingorhabdus halotolerans]
MTTLPLPTRRDETWRYADLDAIKPVWPLPEPERVNVPAGAYWDKVIILEGAADKVTTRRINMHIDHEAKANIHILNLGGHYSRFELNVTMDEDARFNLGAAQIGGDARNLEIVTNVRHTLPGSVSRQVVRSVLAGKATGTFLGKIDVLRGAQKTDAEQSVKAMLLDRTAAANAKPELEIFADDVKCAHGATVGELDKQALFYMASRGLPPPVAKKLMLQAFIGDAFVGIRDDDKRAEIEENALAALEALSEGKS